MGLLILVFLALAAVVVLIGYIVTRKISNYLPQNNLRWLWQVLIFLISSGLLGFLILFILGNTIFFQR